MQNAGAVALVGSRATMRSSGVVYITVTSGSSGSDVRVAGVRFSIHIVLEGYYIKCSGTVLFISLYVWIISDHKVNRYILY